MIDHSSIESLTAAVQRYFDLMYDGDTSRWDKVFRSSAQLHGLREGKMAMFTSQGYKELTAGTTLYLPVFVEGAHFSCEKVPTNATEHAI